MKQENLSIRLVLRRGILSRIDVVIIPFPYIGNLPTLEV